MAEETRQRRRARERELLKQGRGFARRGMPERPPREQMLALALTLRGKLEEEGNRTRAGECAEFAHSTFEASLKAQPLRTKLACRKGCSYCCHSYVSVTAPEAFLLGAAIATAHKRLPASATAALLARCERTAGHTPAERFGKKLPCPLLVDGACSAYAARPFMCRQVTSFAVEPCIEEYEGREGEISVSSRHLAHAANAQVAMLAAVAACGRPPVSYELSAALTAVLATPDAQARWLEGEDVFAGVAVAPPSPAPLRDLVDALAREASP